MLGKIVGMFWIVLGIWWIINPWSLKKRLQKKVGRKLKRFIYGVIIALGLLFIQAAWASDGLIPKIVVVLGFLIVVKGLLFLKSEARQRLFDWWRTRPIWFFRAWAGLMIILGIGFLLMH